ncbi:MAG: ribose-phosphate pyrophosphokinase [Candidatus Hydrogenedentes bacterium]|nr:ribose-phosphate pyrophosphokinase [Candidatus Hydrogenedentota bacterium]
MAYTEVLKVFSGAASSSLTEQICRHLKIPHGQAKVSCFSDGEVRVQFDENVRGADVFIVNSTSPPVNDNLMQLLIMIDAAKRASAERITAVLPYFGYARQDRKDRPRVPITAKLVSNLIVASGADRVLTLDLHCDQIQGFFDIPVDHLGGDVVFLKHFLEVGTDNLVVIAPDAGSVQRTRNFARRLDVPIAIVDKRRPKANVSEVMNVIGDVEGKHTLIFDDLIDTAGTLVRAAQAIKDRGALDVRASATHPVLSQSAIDRINDSVLEEVYVTDSIGLTENARNSPKIKVLSVAPLIGEGIHRIHAEESISILFQ